VLVARVDAAQLDEERSRVLMEEVLAAAAGAPGAAVVLELSRVSSMPSMSIGALMTLWKKLQESQHRLMLAGIQGPVRNTLAICRLDKFFEFCESEAEARQKLSARGGDS
jgi:anti-anti-sigma factor